MEKKITDENWETQKLKVTLYTDTFRTHITHGEVDVIELLNKPIEGEEDLFPKISGFTDQGTITWEEPSTQSLIHRVESLVINLGERLVLWRNLVKYDKSWMTNIVLLYLISYLLSSIIQESEGEIQEEAISVLTRVRYIWSEVISNLLNSDMNSPMDFGDQADVIQMASKELAETIRISSGVDCCNQCHIKLL